MPLVHGNNQKAISENIRRLSHEIGISPHVKSRAQAIAIAESMARRGRAVGGTAPANGAPLFQLVPVQNGSNQGVANAPTMSTPSALPSTSAMPTPIAVGNPTNVQPNTNPAIPNQPVGQFSLGGAAPSGSAQGVAGFSPNSPILASDPNLYRITPLNQQVGGQKSGGAVPHRWGGGMNMAQGPNLMPTWQERQESRNMMHVGAIPSIVPGRTDSHHAFVPSGSYVLPSAHIASMGQGNSIAGLAAAHSIFGPGGPYGSGAMKVSHGPGAPRAPRAPLMKFAGGGYSEGGARGKGDHVPVEVMLAGGEYVIHPSVVRNIGKGSLKNGHKILDSYVMASRRKEIKTQQNLPPPAKR